MADPTPDPIDDPAHDGAQTAAAIAGLTAALQRFEARYEASRRAERRLRLGLFLSTLVILAGVLLLARTATNDFLLQIAPPRLAQSDPAAAEAQKARLLVSLPVEERARLQQFETEIRLLREYVDVSPDFNAGAAVAMVLFDMSRSVEVMPALYRVVAAMADDIRAMNDRLAEMERKMDALPVLATEVQGMRAQMAVMAAGVDSTMGRAGRMLPWNW
jgi:hypothetical protein